MYPPTSSRSCGDPYVMRTMPVIGIYLRGPTSRSVHRRHEPLEHLRIGFGHHAVAQIEDVAGPTTGAGQDVGHAGLRRVPASHGSDRVEVALDSAIEADALPGFVEPHPPVDAHDVAA